MMRNPFVLRRDRRIEARLTDVECDVLQRVAEQVAQASQEQTVDRLFPSAYPEDAEREAEFRALTQNDLASFKVNAARALIRSLQEGERKRSGAWHGLLDEETSRAWLSVLNDARLVMGTSLGVTDDWDHEPLPPEDPNAHAQNLYLYLSGLEEMLIDVLAARDLPEEGSWE